MKNKILIIVSGEIKEETSAALFNILNHRFNTLKTKGIPGIFDYFSYLFSQVVIVEDSEADTARRTRSFLRKFSVPIAIMTGKTKEKNILLRFPERGSLIIDQRLAKKITRKRVKKTVTFGVGKSADIYVTDIKRPPSSNGEKNFKVSHKGSVTPFWIKGKIKKREIYGILAALSVASILNLNFVEISSKIKEKKLFRFT